MKLFNRLVILLLVFQNMNAQEKYELLFDGNASFTVLFNRIDDNLEVHFLEQPAFDVYNFSKKDSINKKLQKTLINKLRRHHKVVVPISKYPDVFKHLDNIFKKAKSKSLEEAREYLKKHPYSNYCNFDFFLYINDKVDIFVEHKEEIKEHYYYVIDVLKNEFNDYLIENNLNKILAELGIYSRVISKVPLILEIYNVEGYLIKEGSVRYDFPKADDIFLVLKGDLYISEYNTEYLASNYKNVYFIIEDAIYNHSFEVEEGIEGKYHAINYHLQQIENGLSKSNNEIKFKYSERQEQTFMEHSEGDFLSKRIEVYEDFNDDYTMYIFENYITGFNIGVVLFNDSKVEEIRIWNRSNENFPRSYNLDFYKSEPERSNFKLEINNIGGRIEGAFSGILFNEVTDDKIRIEEGEFVIDTNQKYINRRPGLIFSSRY